MTNSKFRSLYTATFPLRIGVLFGVVSDPNGGILGFLRTGTSTVTVILSVFDLIYGMDHGVHCKVILNPLRQWKSWTSLAHVDTVTVRAPVFF